LATRSTLIRTGLDEQDLGLRSKDALSGNSPTLKFTGLEVAIVKSALVYIVPILAFRFHEASAKWYGLAVRSEDLWSQS
jgi:hypothetical protein